MKRYVAIFAFVLSLFAFTSLTATAKTAANSAQSAQGTVVLHFFYSRDCPHCVAAHPFVDKLKAEYPWLKVRSYEVTGNPSYGRLFEKMARDHGKEAGFFPTFFVGDQMIVGYTSADSTGAQLREAILANHNQ